MVEKLCNERVLKLRHSSQQAKQQVLPMILERGLKVEQTIGKRRILENTKRHATHHSINADEHHPTVIQCHSPRCSLNASGQADMSYIQRIPSLSQIDEAYLYPQDGK